MYEKKTLTREVSRRYQHATKKEKGKIIDELVKTTGYNHTHITHVLTNRGKTTGVILSTKRIMLKAVPKKRRKGGGRKPVYLEEFVSVLKAIWTFF